MLALTSLAIGILAIGFPVILTVDISCDESDICQGEGPLPERPCCGGLGGAKCTPENGDCNTLLGYECSSTENGAGFCSGNYGMTVTNVSITSISLSWDDFKPPDYTFEYSILYSTVFYNDTLLWTREEHGDMSFTTVYGLQPDTLYFMRVVTWQQLGIIANLTETVVISTTVLPYCYYNNRKFRVGQEFQIDCEDVCVCMTDGELECRPVCNDTSLLLPTEPNLVCREEMKGCCPTTVCDEKNLLTEPVETTIVRSEYQTCSRFNDLGIRTWHKDCVGYCNCTGNDIICYPLCPTNQKPVLSGTDCSLVNQPYLCCHQWVCQPYNVHTVTLNVTVQLDGRCEESDPELLSLLSEAGASLMYFYSLRECSVPGADGVSCTIDRTYIQCHPDLSQDKIHLMLSVSLHVRITNKHITLDDLVAMMYNSTGNMTSAALYDGNVTFPVSAVHITQPIYTCCKGFFWNGFNCVNLSESSSRLFQIYEVLERSVVLNWSLSIYNEDITSIVVCWKQLDKETQVTQLLVNKSKTKVHITDLDPSTMYTAWLDVLVQNVTWIHFKEIHFLTTTESLVDTRTYHNYLVGIIVAMVTVTVGVLVGGVILLIRKRWQTHKEHIPQQNAFENKIFEIRVREEGIY